VPAAVNTCTGTNTSSSVSVHVLASMLNEPAGPLKTTVVVTVVSLPARPVPLMLTNSSALPA
jgi:hypothetical protein